MSKTVSAAEVLDRLNSQYRGILRLQDSIAARLEELNKMPHFESAVFSDERETLLRISKMRLERVAFYRWLSAGWEVTPEEEKIAWEAWKASARIPR
jgi:hypothetical protein